MRFLKEDFNDNYSKLKQEIKDIIRQSFSGLDDEDYNDLVGDYLIVEIDEINDFNAKVEVRAELSYNQLDKLANKLDLIIQKYDEEAYFDHEDAGIICAYIKTDAYRKWKGEDNDLVEASQIPNEDEHKLEPQKGNLVKIGMRFQINDTGAKEYIITNTIEGEKDRDEREFEYCELDSDGNHGEAKYMKFGDFITKRKENKIQILGEKLNNERYLVVKYSRWWYGIMDTQIRLLMRQGPNADYSKPLDRADNKLLLFKDKQSAEEYINTNLK